MAAVSSVNGARPDARFAEKRGARLSLRGGGGAGGCGAVLGRTTAARRDERVGCEDDPGVEHGGRLSQAADRHSG